MTLGRVCIGRISAVPVYLHASWLLVFALTAWGLATRYFPVVVPELSAFGHWAMALCATLLLFLSILLHEAGHALVARRSGIGVRSVTLFVFGGVAELERDPQDGRTELRMAIAGPLVSLALAGVCGVLAQAPGLPVAAAATARLLAAINVILGLFNLVPALPLDGGRVLRGLLWKRLGRAQATRMASVGGALLALFLVASGALALLQGALLTGVWHVALGLFLWDAAGRTTSEARVEAALRGLTVADVMLTSVGTLPAAMSLAEAVEEGFRRTGYGAYPVLRGEELAGLLCLEDVARVAPAERPFLSVQAAMRPLLPALLAEPSEPIAAVLPRLATNGTGRLLVACGGRLAGFVTLSALLRLIRAREELPQASRPPNGGMP